MTTKVKSRTKFAQDLNLCPPCSKYTQGEVTDLYILIEIVSIMVTTAYRKHNGEIQ